MLEEKTNDGNSVSPLQVSRKDCSSREGLWTHLWDSFGGVKYPGLLWCFILHCEALPLIPLRNRTMGSQGCNINLTTLLRGDFLPKVFSLIDAYLSEWNLDLDIDGNIFIALLGILLSDTTLSLSGRLGDSLSHIATSIVLPSENALYIRTLRSVFPTEVSHPQPRPLAAASIKLLPFHHDIFNEGFALINLSSDESKETIEYGAMEFGKDTAFNDKFHWHNPKRHILPKHLGGERAKPSDEKQRMKMMKKHQRFMSRLTTDAATLTGALGAPFNRLIIVTRGAEDAQQKHIGHSVCLPSPFSASMC